MAHISISPEQILQQLEEILNSSLFENKNRLKRFLSYVVNETLNGNAQLIKGYTLGLEVFDKDESFNPQEDAIVRVEAGRLRRLLENYYLDEGKADPVLITLPKGKYQPEFLSKKDIEPENSSDPIFKAAAAPPTGPAIAVLPFEVIGEQESASIFAVGITEEIINHLSLSPSLYVISRKITSLYKDKDIDIRELSKELETHYVLEGSIRQAAQSVRVNGQLLNGTNGAIIWTEKFDYQLSPENIITVQDEIASKVSATIGDAYGTIMRTSAIDMKRSSTDFMEAYEAMLLFHDYLFDLSQSSHLKARNSLKKAVEIDPHYADAWAGLSFLALDEYSPDDGFILISSSCFINAGTLTVIPLSNSASLSVDETVSPFATLSVDITLQTTKLGSSTSIIASFQIVTSQSSPSLSHLGSKSIEDISSSNCS